MASDSKSVLTKEQILVIRREAREVELRIRRNKECEMESLRNRFENSPYYSRDSPNHLNPDHPRSVLSAEKLRSRFRETGCSHTQYSSKSSSFSSRENFRLPKFYSDDLLLDGASTIRHWMLSTVCRQ